MDMGSESDSPRNSPPGLTPDPSGAATPVAAVDLVVSIDKIPTCPFPDEKWYATEGLCPPRKLQWQFVDKDEELGKLILVSMWTQGGTHTGTHIGFSADARPEGGASLLHFSSREPTGKVVDAQLPLMKPCSSCKLLSYPVAVEEARPCGDDFKTQALNELEAKGHSVYVLPSPKRAGGALIRVIGAELPQTSARWNSEALKSHLADLDRRVQELRQTLEEGQLCCRVCDLQAGEMEEPCGLIVGLEPKVGREVWPFLVGRMDDGSWEGSKLDWIRREDPLDWDEDEDYEN